VTTPQDELRKKGFLPAKEVAERVGLTTQAIYNWCNEKTVHGVRYGRERWVEWNSVVAHFKKVDPEAAKLAGIA